jgi:hypothetical protein
MQPLSTLTKVGQGFRQAPNPTPCRRPRGIDCTCPSGKKWCVVQGARNVSNNSKTHQRPTERLPTSTSSSEDRWRARDRSRSERIKMLTRGGWIVKPEIYKLFKQLLDQVWSFRIFFQVLREIRRIRENVRIVRAYEGEFKSTEIKLSQT